MKSRRLKLTTLIIPILTLSLFSGCASQNKTVEETPIKTNEVLWTYDTNGQINSSPVTYENTVIFGNAEKKIYAIDATTHKEVWTKSLDGIVANTLLVDGDKLIFSTYTTCYALNAKTGEELWKYTGNGTSKVSLTNGYDYHSPTPILYKEKVLFPTVSGNLYCLDKKTGKLDWQYREDFSSDIRATPALSDDILVMADVKGKVYSVDLNTQKTLWKTDNGSDVAHSVASNKGLVFVAGRNAKVVAYDAKTGSLKWSYSDKVGSWFIGEMTVKDDIIYAPGSDNHVVSAIKYDTGEVLKNYPAKANVCSTPLVVNDTIYITNGNVYTNDVGGITAFKLDNITEPLWRTETKIPTYSSPVILNDTVYFGASDGKLYAVKANL